MLYENQSVSSFLRSERRTNQGVEKETKNSNHG